MNPSDAADARRRKDRIYLQEMEGTPMMSTSDARDARRRKYMAYLRDMESAAMISKDLPGAKARYTAEVDRMLRLVADLESTVGAPRVPDNKEPQTYSVKHYDWRDHDLIKKAGEANGSRMAIPAYEPYLKDYLPASNDVVNKPLKVHFSPGEGAVDKPLKVHFSLEGVVDKLRKVHLNASESVVDKTPKEPLAPKENDDDIEDAVLVVAPPYLEYESWVKIHSKDAAEAKEAAP